MSNQDHDQDKDAKGRSWDQVTDGTTSIATMGAGSTGEVGASAERRDSVQHQAGGAQLEGEQGSAGRTDDLLAGGSDDEQADQGFQGAGNRQSGAGAARQGIDDEGAARTDDDQYDQGTAKR